MPKQLKEGQQFEKEFLKQVPDDSPFHDVQGVHTHSVKDGLKRPDGTRTGSDSDAAKKGGLNRQTEYSPELDEAKPAKSQLEFSAEQHRKTDEAESFLKPSTKKSDRQEAEQEA